MKEYIEKAAVLSYPIRKDHCDKEHANEHFIFGIESVMEYVENLLTADVVEVRHARWIKHEGYDECEACHVKAIYGSNYCPSCGALMDKEDEHEAD